MENTYLLDDFTCLRGWKRENVDVVSFNNRTIMRVENYGIISKEFHDELNEYSNLQVLITELSKELKWAMKVICNGQTTIIQNLISSTSGMEDVFNYSLKVNFSEKTSRINCKKATIIFEFVGCGSVCIDSMWLQK